MMNHRSTAASLVFLATLCSTAFAGCAAEEVRQTGPRTTIADLPIEASASPRIMLDGEMGDWAKDSAVTADANYLYFRFSFAQRNFTLQHAPQPVIVMIDADGDGATGQSPKAKGLKAMGVDVQIEFSASGARAQGLSAVTINSAGERTTINPYDLDIVISPTIAAPWYEGRIARSSPVLAGLPSKGLTSSGKASVAVGILAPDGRFEAYSDAQEVTLSAAGKAEDRLADALIPSKDRGSVRVMSWNIERSAPTKNPQPFRRIIQAVQPDIILVQEWEAGTANDVLAWMTQWVSSDTEWHVVKAEGDLNTGGGVAVISKFTLEPQLASPPLGGPGGSPVRFVSAKATSPFGDILVGSAHLKCCGFMDSPEDQKRLAEADTINRAFLFEGAPAYRIITGDMNLVGSRPPLERLSQGLDMDGSALSPAPARVLGDHTMTTWSKSGDAFGPGRLDYALFSDASLNATQAFVVNTRRLSDAALARLGLERTDSDASDHMPVVVDIHAK